MSLGTARSAEKCDRIGWTTDLTLGSPHPNKKGIRKLVAAFFGADLQKAIPQKLWLRLVSLAERYSTGISGARAFVRPLHTAASHPHPKHASSDAKNFRPTPLKHLCFLHITQL